MKVYLLNKFLNLIIEKCQSNKLIYSIICISKLSSEAEAYLGAPPPPKKMKKVKRKIFKKLKG